MQGHGRDNRKQPDAARRRDDHQAFALPGARPQYGPDKIVDVEHIDLHLTPHFETESLDGICTLTVRAIDRPVSRLVLDAVDLEIIKVDPSSTFRAADGKLAIELATPIEAGATASIAITYRASKPRHGLFFIKPTSDHPEKDHARVDAEPGSIRSLLVPVFRFSGGETNDQHDDRRAEG